jgi:TolA-binding protein
LVSLHPNSELAGEAAMMLAKAYEKLDRPEEASKAYDVVSTSFAARDQAAAALLEGARLKEQLGDKIAAAGNLQRIVDEHATFEEMDSVLYQLAWLLSDLERPDEAVARFQQLIDGYPSSPYRVDALYRLAEHAARSQQTGRAMQLLDEVILAKGTPELLSHALYLKGQLAASQARWPDVAEPMQSLLDDFPNSPLARPARYWVAEALFQQGQHDSALQWFRELEELSADDREDWMAMVALRQAQILAAREQWRPAYDMADSIKQRFPGFRQQYEADYVSGRCLAMQAKFSEARARYEEVIRSPEGGGTETAAMAQWMIGETYMHQQKYEEALRAFYRVESLFAYPHWRAAAQLQAGKCHAIQGEREQAEKLFAQVTGEYADTPFAEEAARRLKNLDTTLATHE